MSDIEEKFQEIIDETLENRLEEQELNDEYSGIPVDQVPDGVKQALRTWEEEAEDKENRPLLYWLLGGEEGGVGTPPYKMSQEQAEYTDQANDPGASCATCEFLYQKTTTGEHVCSKIRGRVEPEGWCKLWTKASVYEDDES